LTIPLAAGIVTALALSYGARRRPWDALWDAFQGFQEVGDLCNG
jgi:hypothetical protein